MTYKIIRIFHPDLQRPSKIIKSGLTLAQAQAHCNDPKTELADNWFDAYIHDKD